MISDNIQRRADGVLTFAGHSVPALAEQYGTPLYLMDEARIRRNCRIYLDTFRECFGAQALPLFAGKAASYKQIYRIVNEEGMGIDAVSVGEIHTALQAGFPADRIFFQSCSSLPKRRLCRASCRRCSCASPRASTPIPIRP